MLFAIRISAMSLLFVYLQNVMTDSFHWLSTGIGGIFNLSLVGLVNFLSNLVSFIVGSIALYGLIFKRKEISSYFHALLAFSHNASLIELYALLNEAVEAVHKKHSGKAEKKIAELVGRINGIDKMTNEVKKSANDLLAELEKKKLAGQKPDMKELAALGKIRQQLKGFEVSLAVAKQER